MMVLHRMLAISLLALAAAGCGGFDRVVVVLQNDGDFPVEVDIYISDTQEIPEFLLTTVGDKIEYIVAAGDTQVFSRPCDELQAIIIESADLHVIGDVGPDSETDVLRDGDDFGCGGVITFTFSHPDPPVSLDIDVSAL